MLPNQIPSQGHWPTLTPREYSIVECLTRGCSNKEIAAALRLSEPMVKSALRIIYAKLGVADRLQAALRALDLGVSGRRIERATCSSRKTVRISRDDACDETCRPRLGQPVKRCELDDVTR